jgi:hypothetical protein
VFEQKGREGPYTSRASSKSSSVAVDSDSVEAKRTATKQSSQCIPIAGNRRSTIVGEVVKHARSKILDHAVGDSMKSCSGKQRSEVREPEGLLRTLDGVGEEISRPHAHVSNATPRAELAELTGPGRTDSPWFERAAAEPSLTGSKVISDARIQLQPSPRDVT